MSDALVEDRDIIPEALRERDQWVCWPEEDRDGKPTKVPVTWGSFELALAYTDTEHADSVGFVFTDDDPFVGVDLDDYRDPDSRDVDDAAVDIIERLDSYTEVSPPGTGYHVLITGESPDGRNRRGSVKLYDTARFSTVTGDHVDGTPSRVARRQDALVAIHHEYVQQTDDDGTATPKQPAPGASEPDATTAVDIDTDLNDEELLKNVRNASNGEKFERL